MTVQNSQYFSVVHSTSERDTALNGRSFSVESSSPLTPPPPQPNGTPLEPQPAATPPMIPLGQYSLIRTIPEPGSEEFRSRSESEEPAIAEAVPHETRKPNGQQYSIVPEHTTELIGQYCMVHTVEENAATDEPNRIVAENPHQGNQGKKVTSGNSTFPTSACLLTHTQKSKMSCFKVLYKHFGNIVGGFSMCHSTHTYSSWSLYCHPLLNLNCKCLLRETALALLCAAPKVGVYSTFAEKHA